MTDPAPSPRETLLGILSQMQFAQRLYQTEDDYEDHEDTVDNLKLELLDILCPDGDDFDLSALAAPSPAPAPAEAEEAMETLLMQGRGYMPTTYDLILSARADTVQATAAALNDLWNNIVVTGERGAYLGYMVFKKLSPEGQE